jgi:hypothetical protein
MRRTILKHAFVILTVAFLLGLVTGITSGAHHPRARLWLASHLTGILVALMVGVVGLLWRELRLGRRAQQALFFVTVPMNYYALVVLGILAPAVGVGPPLGGAGLPPAPAWAQGLVNVSLVLVTVSSLLMSILVVVGLRGRESAG